MCGFVKTLDSMRSACELLFRHSEKMYEMLDTLIKSTELKDSKNNLQDIVTDGKLAVNLLKTIEESVLNQRRSSVNSLGRLLHCLIDAGKDMIADQKSDDTKLSLDMYLSDEKPEEIVTDDKTFSDWLIDSLRKEVKLERDLNDKNVKDIAYLEDRVKLNQKALDVIRKRNTAIDKRHAILQSEYEKLETENKMLRQKLQDFSAENRNYDEMERTAKTESKITLQTKQAAYKESESNVEEIRALRHELDKEIAKNSTLETKLDMLHRKQYIYVQVVVSSAVNFENPIKNVLAKMKNMVESPALVMNVNIQNNCKDFRELKQDVPVIFFCYATEFNQYTATFNLRKTNGFDDKEKIAWVAIHEKFGLTVPEKDIVQKGNLFKNFGGVFNIVCTVRGLLDTCKVNDANFEELVDFVKSKGLRRSVLVVHGLLD